MTRVCENTDGKDLELIHQWEWICFKLMTQSRSCSFSRIAGNPVWRQNLIRKLVHQCKQSVSIFLINPKKKELWHKERETDRETLTGTQVMYWFQRLSVKPPSPDCDNIIDCATLYQYLVTHNFPFLAGLGKSAWIHKPIKHDFENNYVIECVALLFFHGVWDLFTFFAQFKTYCQITDFSHLLEIAGLWM